MSHTNPDRDPTPREDSNGSEGANSLSTADEIIGDADTEPYPKEADEFIDETEKEREKDASWNAWKVHTPAQSEHWVNATRRRRTWINPTIFDFYETRSRGGYRPRDEMVLQRTKSQFVMDHLRIDTVIKKPSEGGVDWKEIDWNKGARHQDATSRSLESEIDPKDMTTSHANRDPEGGVNSNDPEGGISWDEIDWNMGARHLDATSRSPELEVDPKDMKTSNANQDPEAISTVHEGTELPKAKITVPPERIQLGHRDSWDWEIDPIAPEELLNIPDGFRLHPDRPWTQKEKEELWFLANFTTDDERIARMLSRTVEGWREYYQIWGHLGVQNPRIGEWSAEQDAMLVRFIEVYRCKNWNRMAFHLGTTVDEARRYWASRNQGEAEITQQSPRGTKRTHQNSGLEEAETVSQQPPQKKRRSSRLRKARESKLAQLPSAPKPTRKSDQKHNAPVEKSSAPVQGGNRKRKREGGETVSQQPHPQLRRSSRLRKARESQPAQAPLAPKPTRNPNKKNKAPANKASIPVKKSNRKRKREESAEPEVQERPRIKLRFRNPNRRSPTEEDGEGRGSEGTE